MRKFITRILLSLLLVTGICASSSSLCLARESYANSKTGYRIDLSDDAMLLTPAELSALSEVMIPLTEYGNVAFVTTSTNNHSTEYYAEVWYHEHFFYEDGLLFLIDMDNRIITLYCEGDVSDTITSSYATTITDNVYRYASNEDYYTCAGSAFMQAHSLLEGEKIMQPMKYISNALLATLLAMLILFGYVSYYSRLKKPADDKLLERIHKQFSHSEPIPNFTHETSTYSPRSSSSSSGSSSGSRRSSGGGSRSSSRSSSSSSRSRSSSRSSRGSHRF